MRTVDWYHPAREMVNGLVHFSALADPVAVARHRSFIASRLLAGLLALACFPAYLALRGGLTPPEAAAFALLVSPLCTAVLLSRTGRFELATALSSLALGGLVVVVALSSGGLTSFAVAWLPILPLEVASSGSRRSVEIGRAHV